MAPARIFFAVDMDAFYCGVEERLDPTLVDEPFVVVQKNVVASPSYAARALGIKKLESVVGVKRRFPNMRMVNGESLAKYRRAGQELFDWATGLLGGEPIERLGFEELKFEVTGAVARAVADMRARGLFSDNVDAALPDEAGEGVTLPFFTTALEAPDFFFEMHARTWPADRAAFADCPGLISPEMYVAGHLAAGLVERMLIERGYKCSIGVATTPNIAKMACATNKPAGVAVVVAGHERDFVAARPVKAVPGVGSRLRETLEHRFGVTSETTVAEMHERVSRVEFEAAAGGAGAAALWALTEGRETAGVRPWTAPTQVSVEDTFQPFLAVPQVPTHLSRLIASLLEQFRADLLRDGTWLAQPSHFRLAVATGFTPRRARSQRILLPNASDSATYLSALERTLNRIARVQLQALRPKEVRLINVALVMGK